MRSIFSRNVRSQSIPVTEGSIRTQTQAQTSQQHQQQQQQQQQQQPTLPIARRQPLHPLSEFSTPTVPDSAWSSTDFMLGAGMVIIQPTTKKIVVVYETAKEYWFLPRGRKDVGESLEQAALREAYEESGHRAEFYPLLNPTHQPTPPEQRDDPDPLNTEPIYITLTSWKPRKRRNGTVDTHGGEYLTAWYVGQIAHDAVPDEGTGMPDEQNYKSYLVSFDEALERLWGTERMVVAYAWKIFNHTEEEKEKWMAVNNAGAGVEE